MSQAKSFFDADNAHLIIVALLQELVVALPDTLASLLRVKHEPIKAPIRADHYAKWKNSKDTPVSKLSSSRSKNSKSSERDVPMTVFFSPPKAQMQRQSAATLNCANDHADEKYFGNRSFINAKLSSGENN